MRQEFYENGGKLSYTWQMLECDVYNDVVYDIGAFDNPGEVNGNSFMLNGYYFMRWVKGQDGVWRVDKNVSGPRGNTTPVDSTAEGPVACYNKQSNHQGNEEISDQFNAYTKALSAGNVNQVSEFWTTDIHYYGEGINTDRAGLYQHYSQFFETGNIVSTSATLIARYAHGKVVYDIEQSDETVVINGVQSVKKNNYAIRWEKGYGWQMAHQPVNRPDSSIIFSSNM